MKKAFLTAFALLLAICMLASCSAAPMGSYYAQEVPDGGLYNKSANNQGERENEIASAEPQNNNLQNDPDYGKLIENGFIKTSEEPVSTFSADVDTASFAYFRKLVNQGYSLKNIVEYAGQNLRTEELVNYFTYDYKLPETGELFGVSPEIAPCPWNSEAVLLRLGFRTEAKIKSEGYGNNFVFLIDVSGSMGSDDKLPLLKKAFEYLTENLTGNDIVSIVTYSGKEEVVLTGCEGTKKEAILNAVRKLEASGSTNGESGLRKAYEIAKQYYITGGNNRIIMASDGDLNVGISSPEELKKFVQEKRDEGIYLSVLGFGSGNYMDASMEAIADNGNGVYYYIDGEYEAEKVFCTDLVSTLYTVAEDVKLQLTFDPSYVSEYRLVGYENRLLNKEDFEDDTKDAGEVGAGHCLTVCYELKLAPQQAETREGEGQADAEDQKWMTLAVRYKEPGEKESKLNKYDIGRSACTDDPDKDFRFACAVIKLSMMLHKSSYLSDSVSAGDLLTELVSLDLKNDPDKEQLTDLIRKLAGTQS